MAALGFDLLLHGAGLDWIVVLAWSSRRDLHHRPLLHRSPLVASWIACLRSRITAKLIDPIDDGTVVTIAYYKDSIAEQLGWRPHCAEIPRNVGTPSFRACA